MRHRFWNCRLYLDQMMYSGVGNTEEEARKDALRVAAKRLGRKVKLSEFREETKQFTGPRPRSLKSKEKKGGSGGRGGS